MASKGNGPPPGVRGDHPPEYIRTMILDRVEDLMMQGYQPEEIYAKCVAEGYTESRETCRKWRNEIQRRWAAEDAEQRPARKDTWRRRLEAQYQKMLKKGEEAVSAMASAQFFAEATKLMKLAIVLDGLAAPVKVEHSGAVDTAALSPIDRRAELDRLLEKKRAAEERARAHGGN